MGNILVIKDKVQRILMDLELNVRLTEDGFQVPFDSTAVNIDFTDQPERVLIELWAPILHHVTATPEVYQWIATEGQSYFFGHAKWIEIPESPGEGLILFSHTLLGDYLDPDELRGSLAAVATTANDLDDELQIKFSGQRFVDPS